MAGRKDLGLSLLGIGFLCAVGAKAGTPVTLQLDWKANAQFAGPLVAKAAGWYQEAGLDVTIRPADEKTNSVTEVANHSGWIGVAEADVLLVARSKGQPIKAFATMFQTTPLVLMTLKSSGLKTFAELRGKRIGLHSDSQKAIDVLLSFNHMARGEVTVVEVPYNLDPLLEGKVDAMQGYSVDEAVDLTLRGHQVHLIPMSENGYVAYAEVLFTTEKFLKSDPSTIATFLRLTNRGWEQAISDPGQTARMIVTQYLSGADPAYQEASLRAIEPLLNYETHDSRLGWMKPETWAASERMFNQYQILSIPVHAAELADYGILKKLYGE
ncbi:MAG: ABC transporter substrate-binding protein [Verrucomicrobia bacterium]|nr:ABC transporter substrate-binding protein [Verrucomicrobiota bacterium]